MKYKRIQVTIESTIEDTNSPHSSTPQHTTYVFCVDEADHANIERTLSTMAHICTMAGRDIIRV